MSPFLLKTRKMVTPMPKAVRDILTPETARRLKGMSLSALSDYLWKIYAAGYSAGYMDGMAARKTPESGTDADTLKI